MKPVRESRDALKKRVDAEMDRIKIERYTQIAEASLELFGLDISAKEYKEKLSKLLTDPRNSGFLEKLKRDQAEREKLKNESAEQYKDANNSPEVSTALDENVPADKNTKSEALPASVNDVPKINLH